MTDSTSNTFEPDFDTVLRANLDRVFNQRNAAKRIEAVSQLFSASAIMYEPSGTVRGQASIADVAGALLEQFGEDFSFVPLGAAIGHHGLGYLRWQAGPEDGPVMVTGVDVATIIDGKITQLGCCLIRLRRMSLAELNETTRQAPAPDLGRSRFFPMCASASGR